MAQQYAFPNISFNESTIGPAPFTSEWRNTVGVAGVFSKGPLGPTLISNRQDFAALFNEDNSAGSVFIRQAMLQNATNFVISRVMPSPKRSEGTVSLQSGTNPTTNEAFVGTGDARTVGLSLDLSYVGSPILSPGSYLGAPATVNTGSRLAFPYNGVGNFEVKVEEKVTLADVAAVGPVTLTVANTAATELQLVTIDSATDAAGATTLRSLKPGYVVTKDASDVSAVALSDVTVASYPYEVSAGVWGVYIRGTVTGAAPTAVALVFDAPVGSDYYILSLNYTSQTNSTLPTNVVSAKNYNVGNRLAFFTVGVDSKAFGDVRLIQDNAGVLTYLDTGIDLALGDSSTTDPTELVPGAKFRIPFIRSNVNIGETDVNAVGFPNTTKAFSAGTSSVEILNSLRSAILSNSTVTRIISEATVNQSLLPYSLSFLTGFSGEEANRAYYTLTRTVGSGTPDDLLFGAAGASYGVPQSMANGADGMRPASIYLYDINGNPLVYLEALSPGTSGNNIKITVRPAPPGRFRIDIEDTSTNLSTAPIPPESYQLSNYTVDIQTGIYPETLTSNLVRAYFVPSAFGASQTVPPSTLDLTPQRIAPPLAALQESTAVSNPLHPSHRGVSYLKQLTLKGGTEPADYTNSGPTDQDFLEAVKRLEGEDVSIICAAGVQLSDARYEQTVTELIAQAERSTTFNGLRIAVVATPPVLSTSRAEVLTAGLSSERLVIVSGYSTMAGARALGLNAAPPDGFYCGLIATIPPHVSPASVYAGKAVSGVISVDTRNNPDYLDPITRARVETLYFDTGLQLYKFLNGLSTSFDASGRWISLRRLADQMIHDLFRNLVWVRSMPNTRETRSRVASAVDAYLRQLLRDEKIYNYRPTLCDDSNNSSSDIASGKMNVRITYTPVFPADYIYVDLQRDITSEFSLITAG